MTHRACVHRLCFAALPVLLFVSASSVAFADEAKGFALDRFDPAERGSRWFVLDSLDLRGHKRHAVGDVQEFAYKPLVIYESDGAERATIVKLQSFNHVGSSLVLWDRLRIGVNFPILMGWYSWGGSGKIGSTTYSASSDATLGDTRFASDVRLYGQYGDPFTLAGGMALYVPTGDRGSYTGDGHVRLMPRVHAASYVSDLAFAARLGFTYRALDEQFANTPLGSEINFAVSGGVQALNKRLLIGPEIYGATGVSDDAFFAKRTTPLEALFGAHYRTSADTHLDIGIGPGLTRGLGTPLWRAVISFEWHPAYEPPPPPPPPDRDHDAIADALDACPDAPGIWTDDPRTNGCPPPPPDRDRDGVIDPEDACVDVPGVATPDPKTNGCPPPPPDRDGDGVLDPEDACIDVPGVATQDPKTNGCPPPPPDRDGDTIIDSEDACPDHPGPKDPDPKKNGCPVARVESGQIRITEQVKFAFGKATLLPESDGVLNAVLAVLQKHADITKIRVEGHTDDHGSDALNLQLSKDRAASVMNWLVKHGIDKKRIESAGFGKKRPIDTNTTDAGRQNNRRVEFHIVDHKEDQVPGKGPATTPGTGPATKTGPAAPTPGTGAASTSGPASGTTSAPAPSGSGAKPPLVAPPSSGAPPAAPSGSIAPPGKPAPLRPKN